METKELHKELNEILFGSGLYLAGVENNEIKFQCAGCEDVGSFTIENGELAVKDHNCSVYQEYQIKRLFDSGAIEGQKIKVENPLSILEIYREMKGEEIKNLFNDLAKKWIDGFQELHFITDALMTIKHSDRWIMFGILQNTNNYIMGGNPYETAVFNEVGTQELYSAEDGKFMVFMKFVHNFVCVRKENMDVGEYELLDETKKYMLEHGLAEQESDFDIFHQMIEDSKERYIQSTKNEMEA